MSEKLEKKTKESEILTWASYLAAQRPSRPAQPAGRRQSSPTSCQEDGARVPDAREHALATSCFPARCWRPPTTPRIPLGPLSLPRALSSPLVLPLPFARARPPPPLAAAVATASPSLLRRAHELRLDSVFLSTEPRPTGSPAASPSSSSSTFGRRRLRRRFAGPRASPALPAAPEELW